MFGILDRYIIRKFLGTFVFSLGLFTAVAMIIDMTEKIDNVIKNDVPLSLLFTDYYLMFIPYIDALLAPLFVFIAVIFFTSQLASRTEIVAMLASGVSFYRLLVPYLFSAALIGCGLYYASNYLVPDANKKRLAFEYSYIHNPHRRYNKDVHLQVEKDRYVYMENYSNTDSTGYKFSYEVIEGGSLVYKLRADRINWNSEKELWTMRGFSERTFTREGEILRSGLTLDTLFNFKPKDFEKRVSIKEEMTSTELKNFIELLRARGADEVEFYLVELYRRSADPFTILILTVIGFSMASRKVRGGMGMHIVLGLLLGGVFVFFTRFFTTFSTNGSLPPIWGVWIPNIVFGVLAAILAYRAPK